MHACDCHVTVGPPCRCLVGSGASLKGAFTELMKGQLQEVRDSLLAIGFSHQVWKSKGRERRGRGWGGVGGEGEGGS